MSRKRSATSQFQGQMGAASFDMQVRNPEKWLSHGAMLLRGTRALLRQIEIDNTRLNQRRAPLLAEGRTDDARFLQPERSLVVQPALLLSALGAEVGFKAVAVFSMPLPKSPTGKLDRNLAIHDLKKLSTLAQIVATDPVEEQAIADGEEIIGWASRYPLPRENAPERVRFSSPFCLAYERLFLRCVERVAREVHQRSPSLATTPVQEWVKTERARFEFAISGISAPLPGEENLLGLRE